MRGGPTSGGPGQLESPYWEAPNGPVGTVPLAPGILASPSDSSGHRNRKPKGPENDRKRIGKTPEKPSVPSCSCSCSWSACAAMQIGRAENGAFYPALHETGFCVF